jgi:hypothetical protein
MPEQFDAQALMTRVTEVAKALRKSEVYPALVGGVAGGIAGALIAALIAGRRPSPAPPPAAPAETARTRLGINWSIKDVMQLVTVVAALAKQIQEWTLKAPLAKKQSKN